jgi:Family of unknown function (DUF5678)
MSAMKTLDEQLLSGLAPGTWAAISADQESVIASGRTMEEALERARQRGEKEPFILRVPSEESALIL